MTDGKRETTRQQGGVGRVALLVRGRNEGSARELCVYTHTDSGDAAGYQLPGSDKRLAKVMFFQGVPSRGGNWLTDKNDDPKLGAKKGDEMSRTLSLANDTVSLSEAASALRISVPAVRRLVAQGDLQTIQQRITRESLSRLQIEIQELREGVAGPQGLETGEMTAEELEILRKTRGLLPWQTS